ncbi:sec14-like protein 2 [Plakobranchus ocellatus]|uniref:Sec14-like protein 2 n=1 Tax=Plakobranchus ocellatus TaxID=259542 RepID=A0AAV4C7X4_9GAST|nr:sec14-like protein 2 [Plakobranchus ocellatus]
MCSQFKEKVKDISKPEHDDYFFLRWLRARNFDIKKSEAMLRNHMQWRAKNKVDTILQDYKPPEVIAKYYTGGLFGQDKEGALVWIEPAGFIDLRECKDKAPGPEADPVLSSLVSNKPGCHLSRSTPAAPPGIASPSKLAPYQSNECV